MAYTNEQTLKMEAIELTIKAIQFKPDIFKPEKIGETLADVLIREAAKVLAFIKTD